MKRIAHSLILLLLMLSSTASAFRIPHLANPPAAPKNRVGEFFTTPEDYAREIDPQPLQPQQEISLAATILASGVRCYVHCNPISAFDSIGLETTWQFEPERGIAGAKAMGRGFANTIKGYGDIVKPSTYKNAYAAIKENGLKGTATAIVDDYKKKASTDEGSAELYGEFAADVLAGGLLTKVSKISKRKILKKVDAVLPDELVDDAAKLTQTSKPKTTSSGLQTSSHGVDQKINRGIKSADELSAIKDPLDVRPVKTDSLGRKSQRYVGKKAEVAINPDTKKIVSVNPTSSKKAKRLIKKQAEKK